MFSALHAWIAQRLTPLLVAVFILAAGLRAVDLWRPVDGRIREGWREPDVSAVARNFSREGMNLFYPRIDWRGDGPGYVETEFPLYPWTIAVLYRVFGVHEVIGRIISYGLSLASLAVFLALALRLLPPAGVVAAGTFYALNPLEIRLANAIQPEPLMFFWYLLAGYSFLRWIDTDSPRWLVTAAFATALAVLAKLPALHLGVFFLILLLSKHGWGMFRQARVWIFAAVTLVPAILWYGWAHHFWTRYGNSFGISNEDHWIRWDFFTDPSFALGILRTEFSLIWMPTGVLVALYGISRGWTTPAVRRALWWLTAVVLFYLIAARTSGDNWATYYHIVSLPAAALLIGYGTSSALDVLRGEGETGMALGIAWGAAAALVATLALEAHRVRWDFHPTIWQPYYDSARAFEPLIPPEGLLLASGGPCTEQGYATAYNKPYFFYWLDRKGFNICNQEQSLIKVQSFAARGATAFIAERGSLRAEPGFEAELERTYPMLGETRIAILFDLSRTITPPQSP